MSSIVRMHIPLNLFFRNSSCVSFPRVTLVIKVNQCRPWLSPITRGSSEDWCLLKNSLQEEPVFLQKSAGSQLIPEETVVQKKGSRRKVIVEENF